MDEKKYLNIISRIENLIKDIDKTINNFVKLDTDNEIVAYKKSIQIMKQHFESIYKLQFEKTELLTLLERLKSYTNEVKPHLVTNCEIIGELDCYKTSLKNEIFNDTMPSTSNVIYNFCGLWEIEAKKGIYKFICTLLK